LLKFIMQLLDLTLPIAAENLALDEALLEEAESSASPCETLRLWESRTNVVVVGRSSRIDEEVRRDACRRLDIPVLRRISGGAAVAAGPGCLMYALILNRAWHGGLATMDKVHRFVLGTFAKALEGMAPGVSCQGVSDLAVGGRKFSGNSVRCKRSHLLYHGTLLYNFPLDVIDRCLAMPPRQPEYRNSRPHVEFTRNFPARADDIRKALANAWDAVGPPADWPQEATRRLADEKYNCPAWNNDR
jgi:lipoate---protein ligase